MSRGQSVRNCSRLRTFIVAAYRVHIACLQGHGPKWLHCTMGAVDVAPNGKYTMDPNPALFTWLLICIGLPAEAGDSFSLRSGKWMI